MRKVIIFTALAVLFLSCLTGCRDSYGQKTANVSSTTIEVNLGEDAVITLDANHTTGFSWQLAKPLDTDMLKFSETKYITSNSGLLGAGGQEVWIFKTLKKGKTEIALKYVQPWEKNVAPAREAKFTVIIK